MTADYRIYDRQAPFRPVDAYQQGVQRKQNNLLFQQLMEESAQKKAQQQENDLIRSTFEGLDAVMPMLMAGNLQGAARYIGDKGEGNPAYGGMLDMIKSIEAGDMSALPQLAAMHRDFGNRAANRGLIAPMKPPKIPKLVEGFDKEGNYGRYDESSERLARIATDEEKDAVALGLEPNTPDWDEYLNSQLNDTGESYKPSMVEGFNRQGVWGRYDENSQELLREATDAEKEAASLGHVPGSEEWNQHLEQAYGGADKRPPASQFEAAGFAVRADRSGHIIDQLGSLFTGMTSRGTGLVPQGMRTQERQVFDQAVEDFINANLRDESGATIQDQEFDRAYSQYIPRPGDSEAVLAAKADNRRAIIASLRNEAGSEFDNAMRKMGPPGIHVLNGKVYIVGQVYTNDQGTQFVINPDGTATRVE